MEFNVLMSRDELDAYLRWVDETATPEIRQRHAEEGKEALAVAQQIAHVGVPKENGNNTPAAKEPTLVVNGSDVFNPSEFDVDSTDVTLDDAKLKLAQLAQEGGHKDACFRLIEYYAGAGAGLSKVDPKKYGAICNSADYLLKNRIALARWAYGEDTTKPAQ